MRNDAINGGKLWGLSAFGPLRERSRSEWEVGVILSDAKNLALEDPLSKRYTSLGSA